MKHYRRRGPTGPTRSLLRLLDEAGPEGLTHLDIGGGVGVLAHELRARGTAATVLVDGSKAFLDAAARLDPDSGARYLHGDYVALADEAGDADVTTLDKVICCYPDMEGLVTASASRTRRFYGAVYPRRRWFLGALMALSRPLVQRITGAQIGYLHDPSAIRSTLRAEGFTLRSAQTDILWHIEVFERVGPGSD